MRPCFSLKSSSPTSPATNNHHPDPPITAQANSTDGTTRSQVSPTVNLTGEYIFGLQTNSYKEMLSIIHNNQEADLLSQVLNPSRQCVEEALRHSKPNTLTRLISEYFDHSENTANLCISLHRCISRARENYFPMHKLLQILPHDSHTLTQSQWDWAFQVFHQFDQLDNPFPSPDSHNFHHMRCCFTQLKQQLDNRLRKSQSRVKLGQHGKTGSALCLIGTAVTTVVSAAAIASHALVAIVACPLCITYFPCDFIKKEVAHTAQLEAAAKGTFVLNNDLDTIDRLVARLHTAIEDDKSLIRLGLERDRDMYAIQEVVKQLRKGHVNFNSQLEDLEERIFLCFNMVNRTRSLLLQEIHLHNPLSGKN